MKVNNETIKKIIDKLKNCSNCDHAFLNEGCQDCNQNDLPGWTNKTIEELIDETRRT